MRSRIQRIPHRFRIALPLLAALAIATHASTAQTVLADLKTDAPTQDIVSSFVGTSPNAWAWIETSTLTTQIGQSFKFTPVDSSDYLLKKITLQVSTVTSNFTAPSGFTLRVYENQGNLDNPATDGALLCSLSGQLQLATVDAGKYLTFDLGSVAVPMQSGKIYSFLLAWDSPQSYNRVSFVTGANYPVAMGGYRWQSAGSDVWTRVTGSQQGMQIYVEATAVPEPKAGLLMLLGLGAIPPLLRRRRAARSQPRLRNRK